jgi:hypothetical protein
MKTQQEIEQLAEKHYTQITLLQRTAFKLGYSQCQKDMLEFLETEIIRAFIHGQENAQKMEAGLERDEVKDYTNSRIRILNKQD